MRDCQSAVVRQLDQRHADRFLLFSLYSKVSVAEVAVGAFILSIGLSEAIEAVGSRCAISNSGSAVLAEMSVEP